MMENVMQVQSVEEGLILRSVSYIVMTLALCLMSQSSLSVPNQLLPQPSSSDYKLKISFPVSWEITGSDFAQDGIATQSESFRELWTLEMTPNGQSSLRSPRAVVSVYTLRMESLSVDPFTLYISPAAIEALLGLTVTGSGAPTYLEPVDSDNHPLIIDDLIMLTFNPYSNSTEEHHIRLSKTSFYTVIFTLSR
jgi:hypothetical protein